MSSIPITHILFLSTALFFIGMYGFFTRRNMITMLMSIELMLNSVNINFVAFNKYLFPGSLDGIFFTIFVITIAAAEAAGKRQGGEEGKAGEELRTHRQFLLPGW